jgi:DNA-binding transcriptional LysR family regulator
MKLRGLDLDDLVVLAMLGDDISVTKIGHYLYITQPAVSQRIRKIEDLLGIKIVYRNSRSLKLTRDGNTVSAAAKQSLVMLMHSIPNPLSNGRSNPLVDYILSISRNGTANECYDS